MGAEKPGPFPLLGKTRPGPESCIFLTPRFLSPPCSSGAFEHLLSKVENLDRTQVNSVQHMTDFLFWPLLNRFAHWKLPAKQLHAMLLEKAVCP